MTDGLVPILSAVLRKEVSVSHESSVANVLFFPETQQAQSALAV